MRARTGLRRPSGRPAGAAPRPKPLVARGRTPGQTRARESPGKGSLGRLGATASDSEVVASLDAFPNCDFFDVRAIVRPWRQEAVVSALLDVGVRGLTQAAVKGIGRQGGAAKERFMGKEYGSNDLVDKIQLSIVVPRDQVQVVCNTVIESARTGEIGDGKIFIYPTADVIRIRTKERGAP